MHKHNLNVVRDLLLENVNIRPILRRPEAPAERLNSSQQIRSLSSGTSHMAAEFIQRGFTISKSYASAEQEPETVNYIITSSLANRVLVHRDNRWWMILENEILDITKFEFQIS